MSAPNNGTNGQLSTLTLGGEKDLGRKFYTYDYLRDGADYICPAAIEPALAWRMQELAGSLLRAARSF